MATMADSPTTQATKPRPKIGRPSLYTEEIAESILDRLAAGESLAEVCRTKGFPNERTVRGWTVDDVHDFAPRYWRARMIQAHGWLDEIREELDRPLEAADPKALNAEVQLRRLKVDTLKWGLAKLLPANFGDRLRIDGRTEVRVTVVPPILRASDTGARVLPAAPANGEQACENNETGKRLPQPEPAPEPEPELLPGVPQSLIEAAQGRWSPQPRADGQRVLGVASDGRGGFAIARRVGSWIGRVTHRLQDHRLLEVLQGEVEAAVIVDSRSLFEALRARGARPAESTVERAIPRLLEVLRDADPRHGPPLALPPDLTAAALRAVALAFAYVERPTRRPSYFDDHELRHREPPRPDEFGCLP